MRPWVMQGNKEHEMVVQEEVLVGLGSENVSFPPPKVPPIPPQPLYICMLGSENVSVPPLPKVFQFVITTKFQYCKTSKVVKADEKFQNKCQLFQETKIGEVRDQQNLECILFV